MNTYVKYCPNVFVAKCSDRHEKGQKIMVTTKHGKEHECIVFNCVGYKDGFSQNTGNRVQVPESLEYYEYKLEEAKLRHEKLKSGEIERDHSFSLTYAKKEVNELQKKLDIAKKLWGE